VFRSIRRLPLLINGWEAVDSFGFLYTDLFKRLPGLMTNQPILVLRAPVFERYDAGGGIVADALNTEAAKQLDTFQSWSSAIRNLVQNPAKSGEDRVSMSGDDWIMFPGDVLSTR
jgi:hypothetical protein